MGLQVSAASPIQSRDRRYAEVAYRDILFTLVNENTEWLDIGCGRSLIREWLPKAHEAQLQLHHMCKRIVGIDLEDADVRQNPYIHEGYVGDVEHLPFPDGSFNLITAQMVVEHIADPLAMLKECARVLVPGGQFFFITPNLRNWLVSIANLVPYAIKQPLTAFAQSRKNRDIFPTQYRMNTAAAVHKILSVAGMQPEFIEYIDGSPDLAFVPFLNKIEQWIRAVQPETLRSDLLVLARKPFAHA